MKTLPQIRHDAVILSCLTQGLEILDNNGTREAGNAAGALIEVIVERAKQLDQALDGYDPRNDPEK